MRSRRLRGLRVLRVSVALVGLLFSFPCVVAWVVLRMFAGAGVSGAASAGVAAVASVVVAVFAVFERVFPARF